jgi:ParB family chromosome partitioning protein
MAKPSEPPASGKKNVLGRGLSALIPSAPASSAAAAAAAAAPPPPPTVIEKRGSALNVAIEDLRPRKHQPRQKFDEAPLQEMAESIRALGIVQPLVVTREGQGFVIIAGERRWRAAQKAGLKEVPVLIREATETQALELALVENIQRQDLNPLEEAEAYQRLIGEHGLTQDDLARKVGKDRSTVANALRLLRLPEKVRDLVWEGQLSMGHARALLALSTVHEMEVLARKVVDKQLSVRATEGLARKPSAPAASPAGGGAATETGKNGTSSAAVAPAAGPSANVRDLEARLQRALGTRVRVVENTAQRSQGHLEIHYHSLEELDRLLDRLLTG